MSRVAPAYEREPYRRELEVEILDCGPGGDGEPPWAVLDDTILYPEGGGQPTDRGRLGATAVIHVRRVEDAIRHELESPVSRGGARLVLDWERRYDHMQQHTAQHVLSAIALARFGWATTAFHLGPEVSSIDLATEPLERPRLDELEGAALSEIAAGGAVTARRVSRAEFDRLYAAGTVRSRRLPAGHRGEVRLVEITGLDLNTCGGTHLAAVSEIGTLKLLGTEAAHGGCRLFWVAGDRVRRRLGESERLLAELRRLFETSAAELPAVAGLKLERLEAAERRSRALEGRLAEAVAERLAGAGPVVEAHFDDADGGFLQRVARAYSERSTTGLALLTASGARGDFFALAAGADRVAEAAERGRRVAETLEGRGGGSGALFQGKAGSLANRDAALAVLSAD